MILTLDTPIIACPFCNKKYNIFNDSYYNESVHCPCCHFGIFYTLSKDATKMNITQIHFCVDNNFIYFIFDEVKCKYIKMTKVKSNPFAQKIPILEFTTEFTTLSFDKDFLLGYYDHLS